MTMRIRRSRSTRIVINTGEADHNHKRQQDTKFAPPCMDTGKGKARAVWMDMWMQAVNMCTIRTMMIIWVVISATMVIFHETIMGVGIFCMHINGAFGWLFLCWLLLAGSVNIHACGWKSFFQACQAINAVLKSRRTRERWVTSQLECGHDCTHPCPTYLGANRVSHQQRKLSSWAISTALMSISRRVHLPKEWRM